MFGLDGGMCTARGVVFGLEGWTSVVQGATRGLDGGTCMVQGADKNGTLTNGKTAFEIVVAGGSMKGGAGGEDIRRTMAS